MSTAIVICSRLKSRRVPGKIAMEINGKTILDHLLDRLLPLGMKVILAVPSSEMKDFIELTEHQRKNPNFVLFSGSDSDPLARMASAAKYYGLTSVVRITHDKIFVDTNAIFEFLDTMKRYRLDYVYGSGLIPGTGFEIISAKALFEAAEKFTKVEHISYAIRSVTDNSRDVVPIGTVGSPFRLLIDFPEDVELMKAVFGILGNDCTRQQVLDLLMNNPWLMDINAMPSITVYTCAYNAEKWIQEAMGSVAAQKDFSDHEYILVDDCSTDRTALLMLKFASIYRNVRYIRNNRNLGLASSSNVALENARGSFICRLDADDYFVPRDSLEQMMIAIMGNRADVVYPANYYGNRNKIQHGWEQHHVGGALFRTRALNHIKFTEGLRGYEGLDLYKRAQETLKIAYLAKPVFMYRQHGASMSKTNLEERARIKAEIEARHGVAPITHGGTNDSQAISQ